MSRIPGWASHSRLPLCLVSVPKPWRGLVAVDTVRLTHALSLYVFSLSHSICTYFPFEDHCIASIYTSIRTRERERCMSKFRVDQGTTCGWCLDPINEYIICQVVHTICMQSTTVLDLRIQRSYTEKLPL